MERVKSPTAKELAFALFDEGKRPRDPEVKNLGIKSKTRYNYYQEWQKAGEVVGEPEAPVEGVEGSEGTTSAKSAPSAATPSKVAGRAIEVGKITITPENWGMTQYGAILILDTYNKAKRDLGYGGTIGEFLCDVTEFYRRILNYKEVEYVTATGEGGGGNSEDGEAGIESAVLIEG